MNSSAGCAVSVGELYSLEYHHRYSKLFNCFTVDDRGREDYVRNPEPEENGYYTETDPAREKLVYSAIRYVNRKRLHPYYKQTAPLLPEQTKGTSFSHGLFSRKVSFNKSNSIFVFQSKILVKCPTLYVIFWSFQTLLRSFSPFGNLILGHEFKILLIFWSL